MTGGPSPDVPLITGDWPALAEHLAGELAPRLRDLTSLQRAVTPPLVIVPGASVTRDLVEAIARKIPRGCPLPDFITPEALADRITTDLPPIAPPLLRSLTMEAAASAAGSDDMLFPGAALPAMALRSWRDVVDAGLDPWSLRPRLPAPQRRRLTTLQGLWRRYAEMLTQRGFSDPATRMRSAIERLAERPVECFAVYGFYDATGLQTALIRTVIRTARSARVYVPGQILDGNLTTESRFAERFILQLGLPVDAASPLPRASAPSIARPFTSPARERERTCDALRAAIDRGIPPADLGVVQRSLEPVEIDLWQRAAATRNMRFAIPETMPLRLHRFGRAMLLLLNLPERRFRRADVIELIESDLAPLRAMTSRSARIDRAMRRLQLTGGTSATLRSRVWENPPEELESYLQALEVVERLTATPGDQMTGVEWANRLTSWSDTLTASSESDLQALESIDAIIVVLRQSGRIPVTRTSVQSALEDPAITLRASSGGVFLGDFMQARGRAFRILHLCGSDEGRLPQGRNEDPLLPDAVREAIDLRRIGSGEPEERMLFDLLLGSASEQIVISWSEADSKGKSRRPSPLVIRELTARHPEHAVAIIENAGGWAAARWPDATPSASLADEAALRILARGPATPSVARTITLVAESGQHPSRDGYLDTEMSPLARIAETLAAISPTALERYGACPQSFLLRSVLRIDDNEDPDDTLEMEARRRGLVTHSILEQFYGRHLDAGLAIVRDEDRPANELRKLIEPLAVEAFAREDLQFPARVPRLRDLEREHTIEEISRFLVLDLRELTESAFRPTYFEYAFGEMRDSPMERAPVIVEVAGMRLTIRGVIDRVDLHPDGRVRIIDYKTGKGSSHEGLQERTTNGQRLQLALYCRAWSDLHSVPAAMISAQILPTGFTGSSRDKFTLQFGEVAERLERVLTLFSEGISGGRFPAFYGKHCDYCPAEPTCRTRNDPDERLALSRFAHPAAMLWPAEEWS